MLNYDHLLLGNKITVQQPSTHVDTTFCTRAVLEDLMKIKVRTKYKHTIDYNKNKNDTFCCSSMTSERLLEKSIRVFKIA